MAKLTLSEARGPLNNLMDNLSGDHGYEWLDFLKRMLRKELIVKKFQVWKTIVIRAKEWTREAIEAEFSDEGCGFFYEWVPRTIALLKPLKAEIRVDLVLMSVGDMGFKQATITEIFNHALDLGLEVCPPQVGLELCLAWNPLSEPKQQIFVGMEPVVSGTKSGDQSPSCIFFVTNRHQIAGCEKELGVFYEAYRSIPNFESEDQFIFIRPRR